MNTVIITYISKRQEIENGAEILCTKHQDFEDQLEDLKPILTIPLGNTKIVILDGDIFFKIINEGNLTFGFRPWCMFNFKLNI